MLNHRRNGKVVVVQDSVSVCWQDKVPSHQRELFDWVSVAGPGSLIKNSGLCGASGARDMLKNQCICYPADKMRRYYPCCRPKVDRGALQERYPFIRDFVEIDCQSNKNIAELKPVLCREVDRLKGVREPFPESWDAVRCALTVGRKKRTHLSYAEYRTLCAKHGVMDEGQQDSLAEILHHLGTALNYRNDPRLREATVLQPEWLTKNVYGLVRRAEKQDGVLKHEDVEVVLRKGKDAFMRAYLVQIMERFDMRHVLKTRMALSGWCRRH